MTNVEIEQINGDRWTVDYGKEVKYNYHLPNMDELTEGQQLMILFIRQDLWKNGLAYEATYNWNKASFFHRLEGVVFEICFNKSPKKYNGIEKATIRGIVYRTYEDIKNAIITGNPKVTLLPNTDNKMINEEIQELIEIAERQTTILSDKVKQQNQRRKITKVSEEAKADIDKFIDRRIDPDILTKTTAFKVGALARMLAYEYCQTPYAQERNIRYKSTLEVMESELPKIHSELRNGSK